jgi:hypothetical protein
MWPGREADHSLSPSAEIKIMKLYIHFPYVFMAQSLIKQTVNFILPQILDACNIRVFKIERNQALQVPNLLSFFFLFSYVK